MSSHQRIIEKIEEIKSRYGIVLDPTIIASTLDSSAQNDPVIWAMTNRRLRGEPYRFELPESARGNPRLWNRHRPFLMQLLQDQTEIKAIQKGRQAGESENAVTECLWFLDAHPGTKAVYTFPSDPQMQDFSNTRIQPALEETDYMRGLIPTGCTNNVTLKQIKQNSWLIMRSAQTARLGEGVDADVVFLDERDRMTDKVEVAFEQSLSSSSYGYLREFSTPTTVGVGINKSYERSCKYQWFVKCDSGHRQVLSFEDNIEPLHDFDETADTIMPGTFGFKCSHNGCVSNINRWNGEWVAERPDLAKIRAGYHISQLSCVWISADRIMQQKINHKFMDLFYNYVLGLPFSSNEGLISEAALNQCCDTSRAMPNIRLKEYTAVVAGIDWGYQNWCVVIGRRFDGKNEVAGLYKVPDSSEVLHAPKAICDYLRVFNPDVIVADLGYGRDRTDEMMRQYPDRVFGCNYSSGGPHDKIFQPIWNDSAHTVRVDRTMHLRSGLEMFKMRKIILPGKMDEYSILRAHLLNLVLLHDEIEDKMTREHKIVEYIGQKGADHMAHAFAYAALALSRLNRDGGFDFTFF